MTVWTESCVDQAKVRWAQGWSASQIARELAGAPFNQRFTRNAVVGKLHRLGLARRSDPHRPVSVRAIKERRKLAPIPKKRIKPPAFVAEPYIERAPPKRGPNAVRFMDRAPDQCARFCEGEEGALGFVCGEPVHAIAWCRDCFRAVYRPQTSAEKAMVRRAA